MHVNECKSNNNNEIYDSDPINLFFKRNAILKDSEC